MKSKVVFVISAVVLVCAAAGTVAAQSAAETPAAPTAASAVPNLINYSGLLKDTRGRVVS